MKVCLKRLNLLEHCSSSKLHTELGNCNKRLLTFLSVSLCQNEGAGRVTFSGLFLTRDFILSSMPPSPKPILD